MHRIDPQRVRVHRHDAEVGLVAGDDPRLESRRPAVGRGVERRGELPGPLRAGRRGEAGELRPVERVEGVRDVPAGAGLRGRLDRLMGRGAFGVAGPTVGGGGGGAGSGLGHGEFSSMGDGGLEATVAGPESTPPRGPFPAGGCPAADGVR